MTEQEIGRSSHTEPPHMLLQTHYMIRNRKSNTNYKHVQKQADESTSTTMQTTIVRTEKKKACAEVKVTGIGMD